MKSIGIVLNDNPRQIAEGATLLDLLRELELVGKPLAVELNYRIVPKSEFEQVRLSDRDRLEIVTLYAGG